MPRKSDNTDSQKCDLTWSNMAIFDDNKQGDLRLRANMADEHDYFDQEDSVDLSSESDSEYLYEPDRF